MPVHPKPIIHGRDHAPGGADPIPSVPVSAGGPQIGAVHQIIPIWFPGGTNTDAEGFSFTQDSSYTGGGYLGCSVLTSSAYFSSLVYLGPKGSIYGIRIRAASGPDYGRITLSLASLLYESNLRPSGDLSGKIQGADGGYGSISYVDFSGFIDCYNSSFLEFGQSSGQLVVEIGGADGAPLTSLNIGSDPYNGYHIADGGPGWYRLNVRLNGHNLSSSGNKLRITALAVLRLDDAGFF